MFLKVPSLGCTRRNQFAIFRFIHSVVVWRVLKCRLLSVDKWNTNASSRLFLQGKISNILLFSLPVTLSCTDGGALKLSDAVCAPHLKPVGAGRPPLVTGNTEGWRSLSEFSSLQRLHTLAQCAFACVLTWITVCVRVYSMCVCVHVGFSGYICVALQPAAFRQPT